MFLENSEATIFLSNISFSFSFEKIVRFVIYDSVKKYVLGKNIISLLPLDWYKDLYMFVFSLGTYISFLSPSINLFAVG